MVTEQELLEFMRETAYKPMTYPEMEKHFNITKADDFKAFMKLLNLMENEGKIIRTRNERYGVPERMNLTRGRLQAHAKGFGFLLPDDKTHPDIYIHANDLNGAMNNDILLVRITSKSSAGGKLEGEVVRIVTRANVQMVGVFQDNESYAFVLPDDKRLARDIFIPKHAFMGATSGQKVVVKIVNYPDGRAAAEGEVVEVLGHKDDPGVDIISIIRKFQLPEAFQDEVNLEADAVAESIREEELKGRRDLRGKRIVTIDGEDAKDLDDAVNVERLANGNYLLGVHIADVSHYVTENSALDREAYHRGCSVYLVDRVIPMLPHRLSNGICSLNPQVDRLTMSCEMEIDDRGTVVNHEIFTSVINTSERMTYTNVRKILQKEEPELLERYAYLVADFQLMEELAMKLRSKRMRRGAIDFDFKESKVLVNAEGKPIDIVSRERSIAEQIIEEFMLKANETVAEHFNLMQVPFLYRIHEDPDSEKLMNFMEFITNFGYVVKGKGNQSVSPQALQTLLEEIKGTKEETVISTVLLRSMKQARYDAESLGHFGLAADYYSHFTSPIRRYPDLIIHRVIREVLEAGKLTAKRTDYLAERMVDIAKQSSDRERVAVEAERETDALKKAEFMLDKVGEEFEGIISSVTSFGMFVELQNTVEGLIRLSDLTDDYYHHHAAQHALIGERTSKVYRIGDEVKVRVARVNIEERNIDFEMVDMKPRSTKFSLLDRPRGRGERGGGERGRGGGGERGRGGERRRGGEAAGRGGTAAKRGGERARGGRDGAGVGAKRGGAGAGAGRSVAAKREGRGGAVAEQSVAAGRGRSGAAGRDDVVAGRSGGSAAGSGGTAPKAKRGSSAGKRRVDGDGARVGAPRVSGGGSGGMRSGAVSGGKSKSYGVSNGGSAKSKTYGVSNSGVDGKVRDDERVVHTGSESNGEMRNGATEVGGSTGRVRGIGVRNTRGANSPVAGGKREGIRGASKASNGGAPTMSGGAKSGSNFNNAAKRIWPDKVGENVSAEKTQNGDTSSDGAGKPRIAKPKKDIVTTGSNSKETRAPFFPDSPKKKPKKQL